MHAVACVTRRNSILVTRKDLLMKPIARDGWEVAGYIAAWENRSLILFKHKDHNYLVQCSVLVDVTRAQRLVTVCYELKWRTASTIFAALSL